MNAVRVIILVSASFASANALLADSLLPKGSTFSIGLSVGVPLAKSLPRGFFEVVEMDFQFPVTAKGGEQPAKTIRVNPYTQMHRPAWDRHRFRRNRLIKIGQRRNVRDRLERAIDRFGYDGRGCGVRFRCEVNDIKNPDSVLEDLLLVLFKDKDVDCRDSTSRCPFSLLHIILNSEQVELST